MAEPAHPFDRSPEDSVWKPRASVIAFVTGGLLLALIWGFFFFLATKEKRDIAMASEEQARQASIYFKEYVEGTFRYADSYAKAARREYLAHGQSLDAVRRFMELFPLDQKFVSHITIMDATGRPIFNTGAALIPGSSASDRNYFKAAHDNPEDVVHISMAQRGRLTGKSVLRVIRRVTLPDGGFGGVVFAAVEADRVVGLVRSLSLGAHAAGTLAGTDDKLVRARFSNSRFSYGQSIAVSQIWNLLEKSPAGHYIQASPIDQIRRHFYYQKLEGFPLTATIGIAESDIAARNFAATRPLYLIAGTLTLFIIALMLFTIRQFAAREKLEQTTEALSQRESQLRLITDTLPAEINYKDRNGVVRFANRAYARRHGYADANDIIGRSSDEIWGDDDHHDIMPGIAETLKGKVTQIERRRLMPDGSEGTVLFTRAAQRDGDGNIVGYVAIGQDISDRKNMEATLAQAQKMEALGQLTGGVAHDFNNLLAVIMGNAELIGDLSTTRKQEIATILQAAKRGAELTQRLLAFSRRQTLQPQVVNITRLIESMTGLLSRTLGATIDVRTRAEGAVPSVVVDPGQLENVLLNLAINSRDAMPTGGVLSIELSRVTLDGSFADTHEQVVSGSYVLLEVSDNGCGMSEEVRKRAIEPFFTTKDVGRGSGLGLPMAYGFARQSNGYLTIYSEPGIGTTIKVYLPVATGGTETVEAKPAAEPVPFGKREKILLVEDDPEVLRLVSSMLKTLDYVVTTATDARAALDRLEKDAAFDLVVTDVVLPGGMSGADLSTTVAERWPGIRILFVSGYPDHIAGKHMALDMSDRLLSKPFTRADLARKLRNILDG